MHFSSLQVHKVENWDSVEVININIADNNEISTKVRKQVLLNVNVYGYNIIKVRSVSL